MNFFESSFFINLIKGNCEGFPPAGLKLRQLFENAASLSELSKWSPSSNLLILNLQKRLARLLSPDMVSSGIAKAVLLSFEGTPPSFSVMFVWLGKREASVYSLMLLNVWDHFWRRTPIIF